MSPDRPPLVIIPAHNEAESIARVIAGLRSTVEDVDLLVVNDHSTDATREIVDGLGVRQIYLPCNLRYRGAVQVGCAWAIANGYGRAVFFDADCQHPASAIRPMLEKLEDADIVIASRFSGGNAPGAPLGRFWGNQFFSRIASRLTGQRITDSTSGMKAIGPAVLPFIANGDFLDIHAEALVYLGMRGFRIAEHPAAFAERESGASMYGRLSFLQYPILTGTLILCSVIRAWLDKGKEGGR